MKTIKINEETKKKLRAFGKDKSIPCTIKLLLKNAEPVDEIIDNKKKMVNIRIHDEDFDKLKSCKKFSTESHSDVILRLLDEID